MHTHHCETARHRRLRQIALAAPAFRRFKRTYTERAGLPHLNHPHLVCVCFQHMGVVLTHSSWSRA